jgi:DNA-directed RNA polymerase specialized sigma24 family protein
MRGALVRCARMFDANAPTSLRVAEQLATQSVRERLVKIAWWSTRDSAAARDLVQDVLVRVLDPEDRPWDPEKGTFLTHVTHVLRQIWTDRLRRLTHHEMPSMASDDPPPDEALDEHRSLVVAELLVERLMVSLEKQRPLAARCLESMGQGVMAAREQAEQLACPVEDVYEASRFLKRQAQRLRDEWMASEEAHMRALREGAVRREVS